MVLAQHVMSMTLVNDVLDPTKGSFIITPRILQLDLQTAVSLMMECNITAISTQLWEVCSASSAAA